MPIYSVGKLKIIASILKNPTNLTQTRPKKGVRKTMFTVLQKSSTVMQNRPPSLPSHTEFFFLDISHRLSGLIE